MTKITQKAKMEYVRNKLRTDSKWALRALMVIYSRQTASEQISGTTHEYNNVGFAGNDAEFLSSLAKQYNNRGWLSEKQLHILMCRIHRYARQVIDASNKEKLNKLVLNN